MVKIGVPELKPIEKRLGIFKDQAPDVLARAINKSARDAQKALTKIAREEYALKQTGITKDLKLKRATKTKISAVLSSKGKPLPLMRYRVAPSTSVLKGKVKKRAQMKDIIVGKGTIERKGFMAEMKSGHKGVFVRTRGKFIKKYRVPGRSRIYDGTPHKRKNVTTKGRVAIKELHAPSLPQVFGSSLVTEQYFAREFNSVLDKHIRAEIDRVKEGFIR